MEQTLCVFFQYVSIIAVVVAQAQALGPERAQQQVLLVVQPQVLAVVLPLEQVQVQPEVEALLLVLSWWLASERS